MRVLSLLFLLATIAGALPPKPARAPVSPQARELAALLDEASRFPVEYHATVLFPPSTMHRRCCPRSRLF